MKKIEIEKYAFDIKDALDKIMNTEPKKDYVIIEKDHGRKHRKKKSIKQDTK